MNWKLYKKDDPSTWPKIDCPILVYEGRYLDMCTWDRKCNLFVPNNRKMAMFYFGISECYYQYIDYVPSGYKEVTVLKCGVSPKTNCQYEDDGYCFDCPIEIKCKHRYEEPMYLLNDNKRIWKEFE